MIAPTKVKGGDAMSSVSATMGHETGHSTGAVTWWRVAMLLATTGVCHTSLPAQATLRLVEVQRIAGAEQDLSVVALVTRGGDGTIWISQPQDHNVVAFSSGGVKVRTLGRRGEGPGSFGGPPSGLVPSDDGLIVFDGQLQRITRFGPQSARVTTIPIDRPVELPGPSRAMQFGTGPNHAFYLSGNQPRLVGAGRDVAPVQAEIHTALIDGSGLRRLAIFDYRSCGLSIKTAARQREVSIPFCHRTFYQPSPRGDVFAIAEPVELGAGKTAVDVRVFAVTGALLSRSRHVLGPSPLPKRSVDSMVAIFRQRITDPEGSSILDEIITTGLIPHTYPPVTAITVSDEGEAWITTRSGPQGTPGLLVVRRDGSLRGRTALASGSRIGWAGDGHVLIVEEQPDGLQDVVLYRIGAR